MNLSLVIADHRLALLVTYAVTTEAPAHRTLQLCINNLNRDQPAHPLQIGSVLDGRGCIS